MLKEVITSFETDAMSLADSLDEINGYFYEQGWTDGLPIVQVMALVE